MEKDKKNVQHDFNWNSKPGFFTSEQHEEEKITLGPDLSYPLISQPSSEKMKMHRQNIRDISTRKAA